jgi:hypothetical protein
MTVDDYEAAFRHRLLDAGFDFQKPDLALAWAVFKSFAAEPVESDESYLFWETGHDYFDFVREFKQDSARAVWFEQLTVHFTRSAPHRLAVEPVVVSSHNYPNYAAFFQAVEQRPEFDNALAFRGWSAELRLDGV